MENIFSYQLNMLRQKKSLSQEIIAQKLYVSRQSVSKWERGDAEPDIDKLIALADIFGVDLNYLLAGQQSPEELLLKLTAVRKGFKKPVLNDVNLEIYGKDRIALLGSNGSGKSTIVNIIAGMLRPDAGHIERLFDPKEDLNVMPQENTLIETLRLAEHIALSAGIHRIYSTQFVSGLLQKFHLEEQANVRISDLSGGQKRRLALLLSVMSSSKLLILDEPTVGMDLESIDFFWNYMDHVAGSVLTITHDFNQIDRYFNRVLLLKDGVIVQDEKVTEIHSNNQTIEEWYRKYNNNEG
ncbi:MULTISPECIES: XRE family transcriptional regulator [Leuconostoc]|jgi:ABC-2 type transport system ATP-binding protein|uniref:ATP-binding cassette domain-containing protein n=1 Tax=Leuconostoc mesenteroides TaxID=1245 RepID=A0A843Z0T3_LEUME|nr:XRE family transcriptional regulator [Leuconostoc mesenteroides]ARN62597.1 ABC transporter [Leuconostoc mesenteroides subsp. mesenteroides]MBZ1515047.1 XRE family transcriptional regulator [Leuconostoc mesenteroides]MBZ1518807.1 XRE family transcriptional regulator [Leuconostoc mesenteroides]MBZ1520625.1 XRE family transcriptional regulator [Leuconostoc mesenteroides]MBZ1522034.1 XRE family transcriptional regulator [Leuconostoc mesenteroides]